MRQILIVDSEPFDLDALRRILDDREYHLLTASSGAEARERIQAHQNQLTAVLVDWILPDVDGVEFLRWVKGQASLSDVEVVVHSASFDADDVRRGIEAGAYYYLTKPFDEQQLEAIMRAAVRSCELRRRLTDQVRATEDAFRLLDIGRFRFRTIAEANLLAIHIASACGTPDASMGLSELLTNCVEHGNLEISYEEKGRFLAKQGLDAERNRRLLLPEYRDRRVEITLQRLAESMEIIVKDEGAGFDFERYMTMDEDRLFDPHGRGVLMAATSLDLEYVSPGNIVRVRLPIRT